MPNLSSLLIEIISHWVVAVTFHKRLLVCQGGVDFWHTSIVGIVAGDPCLFSYWSVGLHTCKASWRILLQQSLFSRRVIGLWTSIIHPLWFYQGCRSIALFLTQSASKLRLSSFADFYHRPNTEPAQGDPRSQASKFVFGTMVNRYGDGWAGAGLSRWCYKYFVPLIQY